MADYSISAELELDTSGYTSGIKNAEKTTKTFSDKIKDAIEKVGNNGLTKSMANLSLAVGGVKTAMGAVTKVIKDVTKAVKECSDAYKTQYNAEVQLETAAKNNPFLNSSSVQQLKDYASEMQRISTMGDEQIIPYMAQLAAAGRTQEEIQKIVKTALDVSASGAMSFESAVKNLNKTYSGLAGEIGESIPDIKTLTTEQLKAGDAVDLVASKYAGLAEATAKATGSSQQLKNAWGDFKENLGKGFEESLAPIRRGLTEIISNFNEAISKNRQLQDAMKQEAEGNADIASATVLYNNQLEVVNDLKASYDDLVQQSMVWYQNEELAKKNVDDRIADEERLLWAYEKRIEFYKAQEQAQKNEEERARKRAEEEAEILRIESEREEIAYNAKKTYAETINNFEKEIELRRIAGEEITEEEYIQEKLNVVKSAFIQMVKDGQGYITEENQGYQDALTLLDSLYQTQKDITDEKEKQIQAEKDQHDMMQKIYEAQKKAQEDYINMQKESANNKISEIKGLTSGTDAFTMGVEGAKLQVAQFKEKVKESIENIKQKIKSVFSDIVSIAKSAFSLFNRAISFSIGDAEETLLEWEDKVLSFFKYTVPKLPDFFKKAFASLKKILGGNYKTWLSEGLEMVFNLFDDILVGLGNFVSSGGFQELVDVVMSAVTKTLVFIIDHLDEIIVLAIQMTTQIVSAVIRNLPDILVALVKAIPKIIIELIKQIPSILEELAKAIGEMLKNAVTSVGDWIGKGWNKFKSWLGFATGVNNAPRGMALVGEQGPELIDFKGGERVYTTQNTKALLGGTNSGGNNFNVTFNNIADTSASAMMRQLRRYNRELAINGVI